MADKVTSAVTLKCDCDFVDGDTRVFNLKNPRSDITEADVKSLNLYMQMNAVLVGDKNGATFLRIAKASRITKVQTKFDLEPA